MLALVIYTIVRLVCKFSRSDTDGKFCGCNINSLAEALVPCAFAILHACDMHIACAEQNTARVRHFFVTPSLPKIPRCGFDCTCMCTRLHAQAENYREGHEVIVTGTTISGNLLCRQRVSILFLNPHSLVLWLYQEPKVRQ